MAVLSYVNHHRLAPPEEEVSESSAEHRRYAEPHVVGHENQHEEVTHYHLDHVHQSLDPVVNTHHVHPARGIAVSLWASCVVSFPHA